MYGHRSIVRIRDNENTRRSFNLCSAVVLFYIIIAFFFKKYLLIIIGTNVFICFGGLCIYHNCTDNSNTNTYIDDQDDETDDSSTADDSSTVDDSSTANDSSTESPTSQDDIHIDIPPLMAYPLTPEQYFTDDASIIVNVQKDSDIETPIATRINEL